jgi:hypothetical protein
MKKRTFWVTLGVLVGAIGAIFFIANGGNHSTCSSILLAGNASCNAVNVRYYGGIVGMVAGVVFVIIGAASGSPSKSSPAAPVPPPTSWPAGWYVDPTNPIIERWWDGHAWTQHSRELPRPP